MANLKKYWQLFVILFVALLLRLPYRDGRALYLYNELLRDLAVLKGMNKGHLPLLGPDSHLGHFNFGPVYYYLMFPLAKLFNFRPYSMALTSLLFSLANIALTFFVIKKWWQSEKLAYLAAVFITLCNFDIIFSKYASNPNFLPFFCLLFFYALQRLSVNQNLKTNALILGVAFGVATQLHAVALISLPIILLIEIGLKKIRVTPELFLIFAAPVLVIYAPYIYYEATHHFSDLTGLIFLAHTSSPYSASIGQRLIEYFGFWFGPWLSVYLDFNVIYALGNRMLYALAAAIIGVYVAFKFNQNRLRPMDFNISTPPSVKHLLLVWFWVPTIILLLPLGPITDLLIFYFFVLTPLMYFAYVLGFARLLSKGWHIVAYYLAVVFLVLQVLQFYLYDVIVRKIPL